MRWRRDRASTVDVLNSRRTRLPVLNNDAIVGGEGWRPLCGKMW